MELEEIYIEGMPETTKALKELSQKLEQIIFSNKRKNIIK